MKPLILSLIAAIALPTAVDSSTYNLICTAERSHQISYLDKVNDEDELTQIRSKYKEDITSRKNLKVSYNLKNNNGFIENNPAKAIRILDPGPYEYAPLFLYSQEWGDDITTVKENEYGEILSFTSLEDTKWIIRIDSPTELSSNFFSIKSLEADEKIEILNASDEIKESLDLKSTDEISTGFCYQIK